MPTFMLYRNGFAIFSIWVVRLRNEVKSGTNR
jgi:hypothetical protein